MDVGAQRCVDTTAQPPSDHWTDSAGNKYPRHGDTFPYECQLAALASGVARHGACDRQRRSGSPYPSCMHRVCPPLLEPPCTAHRAAWLLTSDMDEFIFAPNATRLTQQLRRLPRSVTALYVDCSTFGTSHLAQLPRERTVIETHTRRAPYRKLGDDVHAFEVKHPGCSGALSGSNWPPCKTGACMQGSSYQAL
jgi:hypothetical protein